MSSIAFDTPQRGSIVEGRWPRFASQPGAAIGYGLLIFLRLFYGLFFFQAGVNKMMKGWGYASYLEEVFAQRITELNPNSFAAAYLENFAIPMATPISLIVAYGEVFAGAGLLLGLLTRSSAILAFFILFNIAIGGYYDASLLPFFAINLSIIIWPTGRLFGLDRWLARRYPDSIWFR